MSTSGDHASAGEPRGQPGELLEPALLARLERMQLATRRRLAGLHPGEHRSPRTGSSIDFADYRDYHPGDDFRRIDYHLYARLGTLLVKLFDAEDDLTLRMVVDTSASMGVGGKLEAAKRLAAALGFVGLLRRDVVTVTTFPGGRGPARFVSRSAAGHLFAHLGALEARGTTAIAGAVAELMARPGPTGSTVLVSDLLTPDWQDALRRLPARGGDVTVVHVLDRSDLEPSLLGDLELVDVEGGDRVQVSLAPDTLGRYRRAARAWADEVAGQARRAGASYVRLFTDDDLERLLTTAWRAEGILR
jgi:uncharacterized protein (DUF58 family)